MATLLFAWELGSGLGHVSVLYPLAERLQKLGHQVIVAARNLDVAEQVFSPLRVPLLQAPLLATPPQGRKGPPSTFPDVLYHAGLSSDRDAAGVLAGWRGVSDLVAPDMVIFDHAPLALLASSDRNFLKVTIGTGLTCPAATDQFPDWRSADRPQPDASVFATERGVLDVVNQYRTKLGVAKLSRLSDLFSQVDLTLLTTVKELDHFPQRKNGNYFGNWVPGSHGIKPKWPSGNGKRLFAYLKIYRELPYLLNLLASSGCPTLAYIPGCPPPLLNVNCSSISIRTEPIAFDHAVAQSDAAILHAGHGSTLQFLLQGKPLFLVPLVLEQRLTAARVETLGAGLCVNPHDKQSLPEKLKSFVQSEHHATAAQQFAERHRCPNAAEQLDRAIAAIVRVLDAGGRH